MQVVLWLAALTLLAVGLRGAKYFVKQNPNGTWAVWKTQNFRTRRATEIEFLTEVEALSFIAQVKGYTEQKSDEGTIHPDPPRPVPKKLHEGQGAQRRYEVWSWGPKEGQLKWTERTGVTGPWLPWGIKIYSRHQTAKSAGEHWIATGKGPSEKGETRYGEDP